MIADSGTLGSKSDQQITAQTLLNYIATLEAQINGTRRTLILGPKDLTDGNHTLCDPVTDGKQCLRMLTAPAGNRILLLPQPTAWAATTGYTTTNPDFVTNDSGKLYECITSGTSAGSGGPTGTGSNITDGTTHWQYKGLAPLEGDWYEVLVLLDASGYTVGLQRSDNPGSYVAVLGDGVGASGNNVASAKVRYNGTDWRLIGVGGKFSFHGGDA